MCSAVNDVKPALPRAVPDPGQYPVPIAAAPGGARPRLLPLRAVPGSTCCRLSIPDLMRHRRKRIKSAKTFTWPTAHRTRIYQLNTETEAIVYGFGFVIFG